MNPEATFGYWMRQRRRLLDLTQSDLAQKIGCSEITIRKIEAGERTPSRQISELLATALDVLEHERDAFIAFARGLSLPASFACGSHKPSVVAPAAANLSGLALSARPPVPLTRLLGREQELQEISQRLVQPHVRLLSLVGPPGIGKTRLSLQLAEQLQAYFPDGIAFVPFAPVRNPELIVPTIMQTLAIAQRGDQLPFSSLVHALAERRILLIFDNFEHLLAPSSKAQLAELLRMAPQIKLLLTSRAALHISGEQLFQLGPLDLPREPACSAEEMFAASPAVQLFVERVRALQPNFRLDRSNAKLIAEICARLDGLPLAIELAAARSRMFSPAALLERLQSSTLQLLVDGPADLLDHQRTLRSTLDWSYKLLSQPERELFARLALFAGGCSSEAIEAVCAEQATSQLSDSIVCALMMLERQSLIRLESDQNGNRRVLLLETMREYALCRLREMSDYHELQRRHAHYYADLVMNQAQLAPDQQIVLLSSDLHNLRSALEWSIDNEPTFGIAWAPKLAPFWIAKGLLSEGRAYLQRLLAASQSDLDPVLRADLLITLGRLAYSQGDCDQAAITSQEGLTICRQVGHQHGCANALLNLARVALQQSNYARAQELAEESLALYRKLADLKGAADSLRCLNLVAKDQGQYHLAARLGNEAAALYRQLGDQRSLATAIYNLATIAYWQGDMNRAGELTELAMSLCRELGNHMGLAYAMEGYGMVAFKQGHLAEADRLLRESLGLLRNLDEQIGIALVLQELGQLANASGDYAEALELLSEALRLAWQINEPRRVAFCLECLADTVLTIQVEEAAVLLGAAQRLREQFGAPLPLSERAEYQRIKTTIQLAIGEPYLFEAAWNRGYQSPSEPFIEQTLAKLPLLSSELFFASRSLLEQSLEFGASSKKGLLLSY